MKHAVEQARQDGAGAVVIVGSDIPGITTGIIEKAFFALRVKPLVLGPAEDGGYYLIGLRPDVAGEALSTLFDGVSWGTGRVLAETIERAERERIDCAFLPRLHDVDRPEDLPVWKAVSAGGAATPAPAGISVIIPALDEAECIGDTIRSTAAEGLHEVIVVDGGSTDGTADRASALGARVIRSVPPRARQLNTGALEATGGVLLFLHADTRLPPLYDEAVLRAMKTDAIAAGAFGLGIDAPGPGYRLLERLVDIRSRLFRLPYGDQALFFTASAFHRAGGFPPLPIMDDYQLVRTARRLGQVVTLDQRVRTSARRWRKLGLVRTTLVNQLIIAGFRAGVSPERLAGWYGRRKWRA
jgi:rSAM/selenodomain-associated transferase 2